jgi:hypothetical protein
MRATIRYQQAYERISTWLVPPWALRPAWNAGRARTPQSWFLTLGSRNATASNCRGSLTDERCAAACVASLRDLLTRRSLLGLVRKDVEPPVVELCEICNAASGWPYGAHVQQ